VLEVFRYMDKNKDGLVSYHEFCNICEEKRRDIDPFEPPLIINDFEDPDE